MSEDTTAGTVLAFAPGHNSHGKKDAHEFQRQAADFVEAAQGGRIVHFDNRAPMRVRAASVLGAIDEDPGKLVCVAFFCHGWSRGVQAGFDLRKSQGTPVDALAAALARRAGPGVIVPLYCCTTAASPTGGTHAQSLDVPGGDGGFADMLRDSCAKHGLTRVRVDAHDRRGHTTRNPYVRRFEGDGTNAPGMGGRWLVAPSDPLFRVWRHALQGPLALEFPWLEQRTIKARLTTPPDTQP